MSRDLVIEEAEAELKSLEKSSEHKNDQRIPYNAAVLSLYRDKKCRSTDAFVVTTIATVYGISLRPSKAEKEGNPIAALVAANESRELLLALAEDAKTMSAVVEKVGAVPLYNLAVVAYYTGVISAAWKLAKFLFGVVEPMDDWLAVRICFLAMDVGLEVGKWEWTAKISDYMNRGIPVICYDEDAQSGQDSEDEQLATASKGTDQKEQGGGSIYNDFVAVSPHWDGRDLVALDPPSSPYFSKKAHRIYFHKILVVRLANETDVVKGVLQRMITEGGVDPVTDTTAASLVMGARREVNTESALKLIMSHVAPEKEGYRRVSKPMLLNTLGLLHSRLGCHALAAVYFEQARQSVVEVFNETDAPFSIRKLMTEKDTKIAYNLGLQYLSLRKFRDALSLFSLAAQKSRILASNSPLLWIRMAECCVGASVNEEPKSIYRVVGKGRCRRLIINSASEPAIELLQYASLCARAAIFIIDTQEWRLTKEANSSTKGQFKVADPSSGNSRSEKNAAVSKRNRAAALCLLAFSLLHFDAAETIAVCDELSSVEDEEGATLGRLYAAEALCILGRPKEAIDRLAPLLAIREEGKGPREAAFTSTAVANIMDGDMAAAVRAAKVAVKATKSFAVDKCPRREALLVAAYISLREGDTDGGKLFLRMSQER